jgi:hypothetical protein
MLHCSILHLQVKFSHLNGEMRTLWCMLGRRKMGFVAWGFLFFSSSSLTEAGFTPPLAAASRLQPPVLDHCHERLAIGQKLSLPRAIWIGI